jgi:hypothetical protein
MHGLRTLIEGVWFQAGLDASVQPAHNGLVATHRRVFNSVCVVT